MLGNQCFHEDGPTGQKPRGLRNGHSLCQKSCLTQLGSCLIKLQPNAFCSNQLIRVSAFPVKDGGSNLGQWLQLTAFSCLLPKVSQLPRYLTLFGRKCHTKVQRKLCKSMENSTHHQFLAHGQFCYKSTSTCSLGVILKQIQDMQFHLEVFPYNLWKIRSVQ